VSQHDGEKKGEQLIQEHARLNETGEWLWANPPDGRNREERRQRMATIQAACDALSPQQYQAYVAAWKRSDIAAADAAEDLHPALHYLRTCTEQAMSDIRKTRVKRGLAVWHLYNMGYVFMTPDACFGIDVHLRNAEQLADTLDFLLITHEHDDHSSTTLIDAMIEKEKPVVTRWKSGSTIVAQPCELNFGSCRVKIDIGDHHSPKSQNDMLMYQVDCRDNGEVYTVYHSGDGNNFVKMRPDRKVDVFILHVSVGMSVEKAIEHVDPQLSFPSHILELGHRSQPPQAWRWSFDYAFDRMKNIPEPQAHVLTWGERWLRSGTKLYDPAIDQGEHN